MLFEHLKQSTAAAHRRLEGSLDWMSPEFSPDAYRRLLRRILGFVRPWEALTAGNLRGAALAMFDERRKTAALQQDIAALDGDAPAAITVATAAELPHVDSPAAAWGSWYVLEGSTLGGQLLARHFHSRWNLTAEAGLAYFTGYGSQTGARWSEFRRAAEASVVPVDYEAATVAAVETFEKFGAWLTTASAEAGEDVLVSRRILRNPA